MDRRLVLELLPGVAFLAGTAVGDLFWGAGAAAVATALAVGLRWRWDRRVPWLAVATLVLALALTAAGLVLRDAVFITLRPTIGALAFAAIVGVGALARPPLLERSLDYRLRLTGRGCNVLHLAWIALALLSAAANEVARRALGAEAWALCNALSDPVLIALIWLATRGVAERHWLEEGAWRRARVHRDRRLARWAVVGSPATRYRRAGGVYGRGSHGPHRTNRS